MLVVGTFYIFVHLNNYEDMQTPLKEFCSSKLLKGTILIAEEGMNGTMCGTRASIDELLEFLHQDARLKDISFKESFTEFNPFQKLKIRLKKEIVKLGVTELKIGNQNNYLTPSEWDEFIKFADVKIIDTRNFYETKLGKFISSIEPNTENFCDFPAWFSTWIKENNINYKQKIGMYCTGGVRCEKSTAYLKEIGFNNVYQLKGGILNYLGETKNSKKNWQGTCFVFDDRVALLEDLSLGEVLCAGCQLALSTDDLKNTKKGKVFCSNCMQLSVTSQVHIKEGI